MFYHDQLVWVFTYLNDKANADILRFPVTLNQTYSFEIDHRYVKDGQYLYTIYVDGIEKSSRQNEPAYQVHNVKIYSGKLPWNNASPEVVDVELSNIKHTNFPWGVQILFQLDVYVFKETLRCFSISS